MKLLSSLYDFISWLWRYFISPLSRFLVYIFVIIIIICVILIFVGINKLRDIGYDDSSQYGSNIADYQLQTKGALIINFGGTVRERPNQLPGLIKFFPNLQNLDIFAPDIKTLVVTIEKAKTDPLVTGIYFDISNVHFDNTEVIKDIGNTIKDFRTSGKEVIIYSDWYSSEQYILASYGDLIFTSAFGQAIMEGPIAGGVFGKGFLEKFNAESYTVSAGEFNVSSNLYTQDGITAPAQEYYKPIFTKWQELLKLTAANRKVSIDAIDFNGKKLTEINNKGINNAQVQLQNGTLDGALNFIELHEMLVKKFGENANGKVNGQTFRKYVAKNKLDQVNHIKPTTPYIATFILNGIASTDADRFTFNSYNPNIIAQDIVKLANDPNRLVKAILIRANVIGGDLTSSYDLDAAIKLAKNKGLPVYVSVSDMLTGAAYVSLSAAKKIYINNESLVGSLGATKPGLININHYVKENFDLKPEYSNRTILRTHSFKAPVNIPFVGEIFDVGSYNPELKKFLQAEVNGTYNKIKFTVTSNRKLDLTKSQNATNGKIYLGNNAVEVGLADDIATYAQVLDTIRNEFGQIPEFVYNGLYNDGINIGLSIKKFVAQYKEYKLDQLAREAGFSPLQGHAFKLQYVPREVAISICTDCIIR